MPDFWDEMQGVYSIESALDEHLQERTIDGPATTSLQALTDKSRAANALRLPVEAGTRVRFIANIGSVLTYDDIPGDGLVGTVVTVKTADGNLTANDGRVFVMWDDGKFRPILTEHLRAALTPNKRASSFRMVLSDWDDVASYFDNGRRADELVHRATKDLWTMKKEKGSYVIERLFSEDGAPLKV